MIGLALNLTGAVARASTAQPLWVIAPTTVIGPTSILRGA